MQVNNPFCNAFEYVLRKMIPFQVHGVRVYVDPIDHFSPTHEEVLMHQFNFFFTKVGASY